MNWEPCVTCLYTAIRNLSAFQFFLHLLLFHIEEIGSKCDDQRLMVMEAGDPSTLLSGFCQLAGRFLFGGKQNVFLLGR